MRCLREQEKLSKALGETPTVSQLAEVMGESVETVSEALCAAQPTLSLTRGDDDEGTVQYDLPADDDTCKLCENMALRQVIDSLDELDRRMINLRYFKELTQSETAAILNMSQVQVSRREKKVIGIIRERLK